MKVLVTILIIIIVLVVAALIWSSMKRKQDRTNRQRADELRSEAVGTAHEHEQREARAREAEAEAERARAQADQAEQRARQERIAHQQTAAEHEDRLREADRLDPDVDHRERTDTDYGHPSAQRTTDTHEHDTHSNGAGPDTTRHNETLHDGSRGAHADGEHRATDEPRQGPAGV